MAEAKLTIRDLSDSFYRELAAGNDRGISDAEAEPHLLASEAALKRLIPRRATTAADIALKLRVAARDGQPHRSAFTILLARSALRDLERLAAQEKAA